MLWIAAMRHAVSLAAFLIALGLLSVATRAQDASQNASSLPDWKGQWIRVGPGR